MSGPSSSPALIAVLLLAPAVILWPNRHSITPFHLKLLLGAAAVALAGVAALSDIPLLQGLAALVLVLTAGMLVFGFAFMRLFGGRQVLSADKTLRMRSGQRDLGRTFALPQIVAVLTAMQFIETALAPIALAAAAGFAGMSWIHAQRRLRVIRHTPTAKIVSAAQGRAELGGVGRPLGEKPLASPLRRRGCIWFRYRIEEKRGRNWRIVDSAASEEPFLLDDGTGTCVVEPAHAQVDTARKFSWREGDRRYLEEWILPGARLYATGQFVSENPAARGRDARRETGELLAQWKQDRSALQRRFDADGDGEISLAEWQVAQREASAKVDAEHAQIKALPATHFLRAPADRRDFIISDRSEEGVTSKARRSALLRMAWFGLVLGGAMVATTVELQRAARRGARRPPER